MKKVVISSLVAAVILFLVQMLAWFVDPIHKNSMKYTPQQDAVLASLTSLIPEEGVYLIPRQPDGASMAECQAFNESRAGKPWALVRVMKSWNPSMGGAMTRGFLLNFLSALLVGGLLWGFRDQLKGFGPRLALVAALVGFVFGQSILMEASWMETPLHYWAAPALDLIVGWGLAGSFLAWSLKGRKG